MMFLRGVTKESLWYQFCCTENPSFHEQCLRVGRKLTYTATNEKDDSIYENDVAKGKIYPVIRYHTALELINKYTEKHCIVFEKAVPSKKRKVDQSDIGDLMVMGQADEFVSI